jgi:hypothetical protein
MQFEVFKMQRVGHPRPSNPSVKGTCLRQAPYVER